MVVWSARPIDMHSLSEDGDMELCSSKQDKLTEALSDVTVLLQYMDTTEVLDLFHAYTLGQNSLKARL